MTRWILRGAVTAAGWVGVGLASAQSPSPAALANTSTVLPRPHTQAVRAAAPEEAAVLLMRTTGQPDRRLKVLKRSTYSDGESLVDVQDVSSGQTFTLPGKLADRLPRESVTAPPPVATSPVAPAPAVPPPPRFIPAESVAPPAPNRVALPSPLPAPQATPVPGSQAEAVWRPLTAPAPAASFPTAQVQTPAAPQIQPPDLVPVGSAAQPTSVVPTAPVPTAAPPQSPTGDRWKPIPAPSPPPTPRPTPHPAPIPPGDDDGVTVRGQLYPQYPDQPTTVTIPRVPERVVPKTPFPAQQQPLTTSLTAPSVQSPEVRPNGPTPIGSTAPATPRTPELRPLRPAEEPKPVVVPPTPRLPVAPTAVPPAPAPSLEPMPKPAAPARQAAGEVRLTLPAAPEPLPVSEQIQYRQPAVKRHGWHADDSWMAEIVRREMQPMAEQLATALRPSLRVNAALGLADMRYAARPEVKEVLAKAAMTDPAVMVRTVCVRELTRLGYKETAYLNYLRKLARDESAVPEQLRMAAANALWAVTPRD